MSDSPLPADWITWPTDAKRKLLRTLRYDWKLWSRPEQREPDLDYFVWLYLAGRGAGKTRSGAEWTREKTKTPGTRVGIIAPTYGAGRDVCMEGESGLLACVPPEDVEKYNRSLGQLRLKNGSLVYTYSSTEPERLRGPQHHYLWMDELCVFEYLQETWDMALFGLRLGKKPRMMITTTPKSLTLLKYIMSEASTHATRGSTFDNAANLPLAVLRDLLHRYAGTHLGRQELMAEVVDEIPGALWTRKILEETTVQGVGRSDMARVVVGVDPAGSSRPGSDETGIVVVGKGRDGHGYVLADVSMRGSPNEWATRVVETAAAWHADRIVAEKNQGGEMVANTIETIPMSKPPVKLVHASKSKEARAEPVSSLWATGKAHLVGPQRLIKLEDQMTGWVPGQKGGDSPDHLDAMVWAFKELGIARGGSRLLTPK